MPPEPANPTHEKLARLVRSHLERSLGERDHPLAWAYSCPLTKIVWSYRVTRALGPADDPFEVVGTVWKDLCLEIDTAYRTAAPFLDPVELDSALLVDGLDELIEQLATSVGIRFDDPVSEAGGDSSSGPGRYDGYEDIWVWAFMSLEHAGYTC